MPRWVVHHVYAAVAIVASAVIVQEADDPLLLVAVALAIAIYHAGQALERGGSRIRAFAWTMPAAALGLAVYERLS